MRFLTLALVAFSLLSARAEDKFPTLQVGNRTYTNVTVTSVTSSQIYFMHARGIANAPLHDLSPDLQKHFNYNPADDVKPKPAASDIRFRDLTAKFIPVKESLAKSSAPGASADNVPVPKLYAKSFLHKAAPPLIVAKWLNGIPDTKGKFILIDFWATWCPPCRQAIPGLNTLHQKFKDKVIIMGLSDESEEDVHKLKSPKIEYWEAIDSERRTISAVGVQGIPHAMLIDPDGVVRFEGMPSYLNEKALARLIARYGN
ncbi:MAG: TlpA family protein disulfide reductase [Limisphaerales bacterium]